MVESPELEALDAIVREFDETEAKLERLREQMKQAAVAAVRAKKISGAEAARRTGYSREYISRLVAATEAREILERKLPESREADA